MLDEYIKMLRDNSDDEGNKVVTSDTLNENLTRLKKKTESCTCTDGRRFNRVLKKWEPCEECERGLKWKTTFVEIKNSDGVSIYDKLLVPQYYRGNLNFDMSSLSNLDGVDSSDIYEVQKLLEDVMLSASSGRVKGCSFYLCIDEKYLSQIDIQKWVYKLLLTGAKSGLGVVPYITLRELCDLASLNSYDIEKLDSIEKSGLANLNTTKLKNLSLTLQRVLQTNATYNSYIYADLCVVEANPKLSRRHWVTLRDLLIERARLNLPTYVIGRWTLKEVGQEDYFKDFCNTGRLDLLRVFELKRGRPNEAKVRYKREYEDTKSSIMAGVSVRDFMNSGY